MQFLSVEQYEKFKNRWQKRPAAKVVEGKVLKKKTLEMMVVQAGAPGFRSEIVTVVHTPEE
jgi:hypothetical protein